MKIFNLFNFISKNIFELKYSIIIVVTRFISSYLTIFILTKNLSTYDFGTYSLFVNTVFFLIAMSSMQIMYAAQVIIPKKNSSDNIENDISSILNFKIFTINILVIPFAFYIYKVTNDIEIVILFILLSNLKNINDFFFGVLRALSNFKEQSFFFLANNILNLFFIYVAIVFNSGLFLILFLLFLSELMIALYSFFKIYIKFKYKFRIDLRRIIPFLKTAIPLIPFSYIIMIPSSILILITSFFVDNHQVGLYSVVQKIAFLMTFSNVFFNNFFIQKLAKSVNKKVIFYTFFKNIILINLILLLIINLLSTNLILVLSSENYLDGKRFLFPLTLSYMLFNLSQLFVYYFSVIESNKIIIIISSLILLIFIPFCTFMTYQFQMIGSVYSTLITFFILFLIIVKFFLDDSH